MQNYLQKFRDHFNCSQEAMAAALGVSLKTISRWERASVPDLNPFLSLVWSAVNRHSSHLCLYANALLPPALLNDVRGDLRERSLLIGPQAIVFAMSGATRLNWGVYKYLEGISVAGFMNAEIKALHAGYYDRLKSVSEAGIPQHVVHLVTKDAPAGSTPPLWRKHTMTAIYPLVLDMVSHPISEAEYRDATPKLWVETAS